MRRLLALAALALALPPAAATAATPRSTPAKTLVDFVHAAAHNNVVGMWQLLSPQSRARVGPTLGSFHRQAATALAQGVGLFRAFNVIVQQRIAPDVAVAAIAGEIRAGSRSQFTAYAVPLRLVGGKWLIQLGDPVELRPIGPTPGATGVARTPQIAFGIIGKAPVDGASMWIDGRQAKPEVGGKDARHLTAFLTASSPLDPGRHTVVAVATAGVSTAAIAWTFVTR
jgi:hypothetical protein